MRIGKLSASSGVNVNTIRYYENINLLPEPNRSDAGWREYRPADLERLRVVQGARALGLSLDEIRELVQLRESDNLPPPEVRERLVAALAEVERRVADLESLKVLLERLCDTRVGAPRGSG